MIRWVPGKPTDIAIAETKRGRGKRDAYKDVARGEDCSAEKVLIQKLVPLSFAAN